VLRDVVDTNALFESLTRLVLQREAGLSGAIFVLLGFDDARRELVRRARALGVPTLVLVVTEPGITLDRASAHDVHHLVAGRIAEGLAEL